MAVSGGTNWRNFHSPVSTAGVLLSGTSPEVPGKGVAWNGLTKVTEEAFGAEGSNKKYADNIAYRTWLRGAQPPLRRTPIRTSSSPVMVSLRPGASRSGQQERASFAISW